MGIDNEPEQKEPLTPDGLNEDDTVAKCAARNERGQNPGEGAEVMSTWLRLIGHDGDR